MAKKLLSEQTVNRWAKLSGVKLNENYGSPMSGEREDEMGAAEEMAPEGDAADTGIEMADEMAPVEDGGDMSITKEDDELMAMLEKAVENVLVKMGLGDAGEVEGGGDEFDSPDTDMDMESPMEDEEEGEEEDEETLDEELEVVSDEEIINETLKRVIKRLVG